MTLTPEQVALREAAELAQGRTMLSKEGCAFYDAANPAAILALLAQLEAVSAPIGRQLEIAECAGVAQGLDAAMRALCVPAQTGCAEMDKGQSPLFAELTLGAYTQDFTAQPANVEQSQ